MVAQADNLPFRGLAIRPRRLDVFFDAKRMHGFRNPGFERKYTRQGEAYLPANTLFPDGPIYYEQQPGALIQMIRCERVVIENLRFLNPPEWTFRIGDCDDVLIRGITIRANLLVPNSDGIHLTTSRNVRVSDCHLSCGDDTIAVTGFGKATGAAAHAGDLADYAGRRMGNRTGYSENIAIANCVLESASAGVRVGYGRNQIRNCVFQNLVIHNSHRGLGVFARDAVDIENLLFQNITIRTRLYSGHWWGKGEPIHVSAVRQDATVPVGRIRRVTFSNILADSEGGVGIYGSPESPIEDLTLANIRLKVTAGPPPGAIGPPHGRCRAKTTAGALCPMARSLHSPVVFCCVWRGAWALGCNRASRAANVAAGSSWPFQASQNGVRGVFSTCCFRFTSPSLVAPWGCQSGPRAARVCSSHCRAAAVSPRFHAR